MSYKTYEEYKDSNVDWIDLIPTYWHTYKLKHVINEFIAGGTPKSSNDAFWDENNNGIPWIAIGDMTDNDYLNSTSKSITREGLANKNLRILKKGTLIYSIFASLGKTSILNIDATTNQAILGLITSNKIDIKYLKYYLEALRSTISRFANENTQENLNSSIVKNMEIAIPNPLEEQKQIANYLDKQTSKIDAIIAKNKVLIDLLEEKRTALINQVVTKGLNPDVPMKDSGIEWIGEIPSHWKTNKIKNMSYVKGRIGWHGLTSEEYSDEGAYLVTGTDFVEGNVDWDHCNHISYERYQQDPNIHLKENDLLITKDGTIGKLALIKNIPDKATLNSGIFLVRPLEDNYSNDYLYWILSSDIFTRFFDYIKTGATIAHLYQETFERFFFPYMSIEEQNEIVEYLNDNVSKMDFTIKKVEENIKLLEEYKNSLIHHAVTGKIDVRSEEI